MDRNEILTQVQDIYRDVLNNDEIILTEATTADDIVEWTSLTQVQLITTIEHEFNIRFSLRDMMDWKSVGDILDSLEEKCSQRF